MYRSCFKKSIHGSGEIVVQTENDEIKESQVSVCLRQKQNWNGGFGSLNSEGEQFIAFLTVFDHRQSSVFISVFQCPLFPRIKHGGGAETYPGPF